MPPKNASKGGASQSKKADQKKKEKIIEDKTFGLKNKKGGKQQRFIQQVENQVKSGGNKTAKQLEKEKEDKLKTKDTKKQALAEINSLFRPVQQQASSKGADPKSVLCAFYKQGGCSKGAKCKFSHDLNIERKSEKRSAYVDIRDDENKETSEDWDEEKLKEVVEKKHGKEKNKPSTEIVCRYFLDAVEKGKYGWFWECPNGGNCIYRHALPPGFVLKKDKKKLDKDIQQISLEELIEKERAALGHDTTKVTLETFLAWKKKKLKEKDEALRKDAEKKKSDYKSGKEAGLSGREMFTFNPDLAHNNDMDDGDETFDMNNMDDSMEDRETGDEEEEEEQIHFREIDFNSLVAEYRDVDESNISTAAPDRIAAMQKNLVNGSLPKEEVEGATGGPSEAVAIDEDLFNGDDEDLDDLDEQLDELAIS